MAKTNRHKLFPVVGIGASAGGLEAFSDLLKVLPIGTGLAFVFIQHLAADRESMLDEILARKTSMPVLTVENNQPLHPDTVYVIPPGYDVYIDSGLLKLGRPKDISGQHLPINRFFQSLADNYGPNAIGIILSGTASDGAKGIKEIKTAGGITISQSEKSAKYEAMPHNAVATGSVDFVLPVSKIAEKLVSVAKNFYAMPLADRKKEKAVFLRTDAWTKIFFLLRRETGVDFTYYKRSTVQRRLRRRMSLRRIETLAGYLNFIRSNKKEIKSLFNEILICVTDFFREPAAYEALKKKVFPVIAKSHPAGAPIRIWVPGCATGEEAYSIAICFLEFLKARSLSRQLQIFATDICDLSIEKARIGIYPESIKTKVSHERLRRFFRKVEGGFQISKSIREMCIFAKHNLVTDPPFSNIDYISCRNTLIYMENVLQKKIISVFHYAINRYGFLQLGRSEGVGQLMNLFGLIDRKNRIYAKKSVVNRLDYGFMPKFDYLPKEEIKETFSSKIVKGFDAQEEANRILLSRFVSASALINEDMEILRFWGDSSFYLEHTSGKATLNFLKLLREDLIMDVREAINEAKNKKTGVRKEKIIFRYRDNYRSVSIEVIPINDPVAGYKYSLIVFKPDIEPRGEPGSLAPVDNTGRLGVKASHQAKEISRLHDELDKAKEATQSILESQETANEELKSSLEELQSANEELQSTNEELETAKEELQSTNEELTTVNDEMENRNLQLGQLNNDLINLLTSVNIPIVMVGDDLSIRRFNLPAQKIFNLIPADLGRKLTVIKPNINLPDLEEMVTGVMESLKMKEIEVEDNKKYWYLLRIRPYVTSEKTIDGAVITMVDIDKLKRSLEEVERARHYAESIIGAIRNPLLVLDNKMRVITVNSAFYRVFQTTPKETENKYIYNLGGNQWNIPQLRKLLEGVLPKKTQIDDFELSREFAGLGKKTMLLNARLIPGEGGRPQYILLAIADISERKQLEEMKNTLIRNVAHSIKTPLAMIAMEANLCASAIAANNIERAEKFIAAIRENSDISLRDVRNILSDERIRKPTAMLKEETISLKKLVRSLVLDYKRQLADKKVKLKINIRKSADKIFADRGQMLLLLDNLINNAIKFTPKGSIAISAKKGKGVIVISIKDTGCGIKQEESQRFFNKFYKRHISIPGVGIGLSICKQIIEAHGGKISIFSAGLNKGFEVTIVLPVKVRQRGGLG